ncbi:hypothetical protein ACE1SV_31480 [Streptomyces sp. E-15]
MRELAGRRRLTVDQLDDFLLHAADQVRGDMTPPELARLLGPLLLLKRVSDQPGILHMPEGGLWAKVIAREADRPGAALDEAFAALERHDPQVQGLFDAVTFDVPRAGPHPLGELLPWIDRLSLSDDDLEFGDVVGRAFDRFLVRTASSQGRSAEPFTPRAVCRLMAELVDPQPGQSVADPNAGSGGMLLSAAQYVEERAMGQAGLRLHGQEINGTAWLTGRINLLLHGIQDAVVSRSDSLTDPLVSQFHELHRYDRVLTSPPFSMNYKRDLVRYPERMRYGWVPEGGKKADLMFVQHALSVLRPGGTGAVVVPHGVLFRGGAEEQIRRGLVEDDRLEAVIGIGANVFYNTGIPACILVLKGDRAHSANRRGSVLFVNAEREVTVGRSRNRLDAQHIAKIVEAFRRREDVPGFARVVPLSEMRDNGFNLNISRYVDTAPPPEPLLDIGAALTGGVPRREIERAADRFHAFGIDIAGLFVPDPDRPGYHRFPPAGPEATAAAIPGLAAAREHAFRTEVERWWTRRQGFVSDLAHEGVALADVHLHLEASLCEELLPSGILDRYQLIGALASWWSAHEEDLRALTVYGFPGVIRRWHPAPRERAGVPSRTNTLPASQEDASHVLTDLGQPDTSYVLAALGRDLRAGIERLVTGERQALVEAYMRLGERYGTSMADLEDQYQRAAYRLRERMTGLGYF